MNADDYLSKRRNQIDKTEWLDILFGLKSVGARKDEIIVELGAGEGFLLDFLRKKGFQNVIGVDLRGDGRRVIRTDLEKEYPPKGNIYVFQHVIEHLNQERVVDLLRYCLSVGRAIVGIVPAHLSDDETHVVNHYEFEEIEALIKRINPKHYLIKPDLMSYANPIARDWLIVLSKEPIRLPVLYRLVSALPNAMIYLFSEAML